MSDWVILRTAGRSTLPLAQSLAADGFDVWTPIETAMRRVPRKNAKREVRLPIMSGYVFARAAHLSDLLQISEMPLRPRRGDGLREPAHVRFNVLHAFGRIPMVADHHLNALRILEAKRTPIKRAAYSFPRNKVVRVKGGIFGGMVGPVVRSTPGKTVIRFFGSHNVEIPTSLLELDAVEESQPALLMAA